jgi:hypothetical protein
MKFFIYSVSLFTRFWAVPETLELAAPHCAAGLRVRLYLHGRAPFVWISFVSINLHPKVMQAMCHK